MASTGVKEYTLRINGVTQSVKEVTTLEEAVTALDQAMKEVGKSTAATANVSKQKKAALSDEEKAAKKLADTQKRIQEANSEANKAQIAANQELRERTREVTRQVAAEKLAEGSIRAMGMQLTDLRNQYEDLSAAERNEAEVGGKLLEQIQALDAEYKALRESTGNFRDSVGNYEKAFSGLNELKDRFELAARGSAELAADVTGSNDALDAFGGTTDLVAKSSEQLAGVVALATTAQEAYNAVVKEGWIQQKAAAVMDAVRTVQIKARTTAEALSTKGTIAATIAQRVFNAVANANPYVLLATALISVAGALYLFISRTNDAAEKQKQLNDLQSIYLDTLEAEASKLKEIGDDRVKALENQLEVLNAAGAKTKEIRAIEDKLAIERAANNARQRGFYAQELSDLDANREKLDQLQAVLIKLKEAQARGDDKIRLDIDLDGKIEKVKVEDAINSVQAAVDNLNRTVKIATDLKADQEQIAQDIAVQNAARLKADKDLAKERAEKAKETARTRAELELNAQRAAEDARISLIEDSYTRQRAVINAQYDRQIQDLKKTLATEKNLTKAARQAINESIVSADKQRTQDLTKLEDERRAKELTDVRATEDSRVALIQGATERQRTEINIQYNRQIDDLKKRLATEKDLTKAQQVAISEQITTATIARERALTELTNTEAQKRAEQELAALDFALEKANNRIGELQKRDKTGLKLIDVEGTRKNLNDANDALDVYISNLRKYEEDLQRAHEAALNTLKEGTPEYIDEVQKYASAQEAVTQRIKKAQKEQEANTKESTKVQITYYQEFFTKIAEFAQLGADLVGQAVQTWNMGIQAQIDGLTEELDALNEHYEDAQKQREDAAKNVEDIEARIQAATGGTVNALKEQLADAMAARNDAARNEQQLAKEKEKREKEIAKKERQARRNELIGNIAMSIANTAQGVTKGLSLGFPLGLVVAGIIAVMGAIQVGIMTKQLTKLAKGGPIFGPSHAEGGVKVGMGYEVEGGEFVTNKRSYAANKPLVEFINASSGTITAADLAGIVPGETAPVVINNVNTQGEDRIVEAIQAIELRPVVAVTDILDVQNEMITVRDLAGF